MVVKRRNKQLCLVTYPDVQPPFLRLDLRSILRQTAAC